MPADTGSGTALSTGHPDMGGHISHATAPEDSRGNRTTFHDGIGVSKSREDVFYVLRFLAGCVYGYGDFLFPDTCSDYQRQRQTLIVPRLFGMFFMANRNRLFA